MKTNTQITDLNKLLAIHDTDTANAAAHQAALTAFTQAVEGRTELPLIDPVLLSRAKAAHFAHQHARAAFAKIPKDRRELATSVHKTALAIGEAAARCGSSYSGVTSYSVRWGKSDTADAFTYTGPGAAYGGKMRKYSMTNATHFVRLDPARVHVLVASSRLRQLSERDGLPLIALDADGSATWIVTKAKQITAQHGWIIGDELCCYHSTKSREDAVKGHAKKRALIDQRNAEAAARERLRKASPEYKAERRARLIARLCPSLTATIADARACGYCVPGIEAFQRTHGIGDTATLPDLCRTGNQSAIALALRIARQHVKQAALNA